MEFGRWTSCRPEAGFEARTSNSMVAGLVICGEPPCWIASLEDSTDLMRVIVFAGVMQMMFADCSSLVSLGYTKMNVG